MAPLVVTPVAAEQVEAVERLALTGLTPRGLPEVQAARVVRADSQGQVPVV